MTDIKNAVLVAVNALEEKKGEDIKIIDIEKVSTIADYFIIASGSNKNQVQAMSDEVQEKLAKEGVFAKNTEGYLNGNWILMDYGDIVIHIFDNESRVFFDLERIWRDGKSVSAEELKNL